MNSNNPSIREWPAATALRDRLNFMKLSDKARVPTRASLYDAGLDLSSIESLVIPPGKQALVGTGLAVAIPNGMVGLITPRSGLAAKHGITVTNSPGVIDSGYRGELKIILRNTGVDSFEVNVGDRVAQLLIIQTLLPIPYEVQELDDTERGAGGFGSSGV